MHMETYQESPDPSFPVRDTESDPRWGWLGLACETNARLARSLPVVLDKVYEHHTDKALHSAANL